MARIEAIDVANHCFDISADWQISSRQYQPGPPKRRAAMTLGIVSMENNAPHSGEMHPDGDELLFVISGRVRVTGDSDPEQALELGPGQGCIVRQGEWHQVDILEKTQLLHLTPGPNGDYRPLDDTA